MRFIAQLFLLAISFHAVSQARINRLSPIINHPSINVFSPFVSLDGNTLVFVSDNAEDNALVPFYSIKTDGINWREPVMLAKNIHSRSNFLRGFGLMPDGKQLYVSAMRSGGLGGYDLLASDLKGTYWNEPVNIGQPANSPEHEACPSFTSDGLTMYFMRCTKMEATKADGCKIMVARRKTVNDRWGGVEELPATINTGNSQTPRIMGDGETLIFSSNKFSPSKGGMDLYETRLTGSTWSTPVPLEFANTEADDQFVSATSLGRYLMKDAPGKFTNEIIEMMFPPEVKPKGLMKLEGKITGPPNPGSAYIAVFDKATQTRLFNLRPQADGSFTIFLKEGTLYQLNADPEQEQFTFASRDFDLTQGKFNAQEKVTIELKPFKAGDEMILNNVTFKPNSHDLEPTSSTELRKLIRLINGNQALRFSLEVSLLGYREDTLKSDPDLTEMITDSLLIPVTHEYIDSIAVDNAGDTTLLVRTESYDSVVVKTRYHNDRTPHMALEIVNQLISQGISASRLTPAHQAQPAVLPEKKWIVKLIAR